MIIDNLSNEDYHRGEDYRRYISSTQLKHYAVSPAYARRKMAEPDEQTPAQAFGALVHAAMEHIARFGTGHSECIVTNDYSQAQLFQKTVDAAAVYVNASTRFTDGNEFGFGAEIGISTQKLHARGPMALPELTSTKYLICGNGQVRG